MHGAAVSINISFSAALDTSTALPMRHLSSSDRCCPLDRCSSSLGKVSSRSSGTRCQSIILCVGPLLTTLLFHVSKRPGSQRAGAGIDLVRSFPYTKHVYDEADEALHSLRDPALTSLSHVIWNQSQVSYTGQLN